MLFNNKVTQLVAYHMLSDESTAHTINYIISDLISTYDFKDAIELLSNNLKSVMSYELSESLKESSRLTFLLAMSAFEQINFNEIADYLISDRLSVG